MVRQKMRKNGGEKRLKQRATWEEKCVGRNQKIIKHEGIKGDDLKNEGEMNCGN